MKTNIQIFTSEVFGEIRTCQVNNQIMFVGKDVAIALGYAKSRNALATHVDKEDKKDALIQGPLGGGQKMTIINESGLYSLILSSKLPQAKAFKRWVTSEVLPQIRQTGGYIPTMDIRVENMEQLIRYAAILLDISNETHQDFDELLIEKRSASPLGSSKNRYGAIWLHFAVRPSNNRRKVSLIQA